MNVVAPSLNNLPRTRAEWQTLIYGIVYQQKGEFTAEDIQQAILSETGRDIGAVGIGGWLRELKEMSMSPLEYEQYRYSVRRR